MTIYLFIDSFLFYFLMIQNINLHFDLGYYRKRHYFYIDLQIGDILFVEKFYFVIFLPTTLHVYKGEEY